VIKGDEYLRFYVTDSGPEQSGATGTTGDDLMKKNLSKQPPLTFLAVDDDPMTLIYLKKMLASDRRVILTAENGDQALKLALEHRPHVLITDWRMPELNGIDLCRTLRSTKVTQYIYIIMLTCNETEEELVQAFDAGADDYVVKPFPPKVFQARISSAERLILYQQTIHRDRETIEKYASQLTAANRKLQEMAMTDFLTGLPNRRSALRRLKNLVAEVRRYGEPLSCLMIDIDHFKEINDTYGHDSGDRVLKQLSKLLAEKARSYDMVSRWGGEEFLIICARSGPADSFQLAERLRRTVAEQKLYLTDQATKQATISIGVATWAADLQDEDELIKHADTQLYLAKKNGRNRVEPSPGSVISPQQQ
jgi:diguanylate cyclase (GGDEF)-like protein